MQFQFGSKCPEESGYLMIAWVPGISAKVNQAVTYAKDFSLRVFGVGLRNMELGPILRARWLEIRRLEYFWGVLSGILVV